MKKTYESLRITVPGAIYLVAVVAISIYTAMTDLTNAPSLMMFIFPALGFCCCLAYGVQALRWSWLAPLACIGAVILIRFIIAPTYPIFYIPNVWVFLFSPFCGPIAGYLMGRAYAWAKKD